MEKKNNSFEEIWNKLKSCKKVIMKLHDGPDGDCFGSCTAMKQVLEQQGVEVTLISKDDLSENLNEFEFSKEVEFGKKLSDFDLQNFDALVLLDHGELNYSPGEENTVEGIFIVNIDHHESNAYYGNMNYVNPDAPACCSILIDFFKEVGIKFDGKLCRKLFLGICTDTGFFKIGNSKENFSQALFLIEKGDIDYGGEFLRPITAETWGLKKLKGELLSNMEKEEIDGKIVAYSFAGEEVGKKYGVNLAEMRLGITCMEDIKNVDLVFILKEMEDYIKGSFRSEKVNTALFSEALGGGGHKGASAFNLEKMPLEDAVKKVLETIRRIGMHE